MTFRKLPLIAQIHDIGVLSYCTYLVFSEDWVGFSILLSWMVVIWVLRKSADIDIVGDVVGITTESTLSWILPFGLGALFVLFVEIVVLVFTWKDAVDYIVSHY